MAISQDLKNIISLGDISALANKVQTLPGLPQTELDDALTFGVQNAAIDVVGALLDHRSQITEIAFYAALKKEDTVLLQTFIDHGWDINTTEFGPPPIQ